MRYLAFVLVCLVLAFLVARAYDHAQYVQDLQSRLVELELHDCGLVQYEDLSVSFQQDDATRLACARAMRQP